MFHKIKDIIALPNFQLSVVFSEGITKKYDMTTLFDMYEGFSALRDEALFKNVKVDVGGYGIIWNDNLDLSCDELWENGRVVQTPFDNLISFSDATELWELNESTLRKAISYGKLVGGIDARKYGKNWLVTRAAMEREYGKPKIA